jgi:hypothetical protein
VNADPTDLAATEAEADAVLESHAARVQAWAAEATEVRPPLGERTARSLESKLVDRLPDRELWRDGHNDLSRFTALAVPAGSTLGGEAGDAYSFAFDSCGPAADLYVAMMGRAPSVYVGHRRWSSLGEWVGWFYDDCGFHVVAVTMAAVYKGDGVSIGHEPLLDRAAGVVRSEVLCELSILGISRGRLAGAVVESVEPFEGTAADVVWQGELLTRARAGRVHGGAPATPSQARSASMLVAWLTASRSAKRMFGFDRQHKGSSRKRSPRSRALSVREPLLFSGEIQLPSQAWSYHPVRWWSTRTSFLPCLVRQRVSLGFCWCSSGSSST